MANEPSELPSTASDSERDRVIRDLGEHFAHDHLSLDEYEQRVERAFRIAQRTELQSLTRDLPALASSASTPPQVAQSGLPLSRIERAPGRSKWLFALMSGVVRRGRWTAPARISAIAVMGGVEIDLREAEFTSPLTEIFAVAVMGGVVVRVPPHVRLESDGFAIMGGFEDQLQQPSSGSPDAPVVRVRGFALMGGVEAKVLDRGEVVPDE
jgi:hypothetical protein